MAPIYLDYNASTPLLPVVVEAMRPYMETYFGNPSSAHGYGFVLRTAISKARQQVADLLGCRPEEVFFTSGGSESNNMAIKGVAFSRRHQGQHIITSAIEHPAVTETCRYLQTQGFEVTSLSVDGNGLLDLDELKKSIRKDTLLITIMHANNETGTIQPIEEIAAIARHYGIIFHTDAAQSVGKIEVKVDALGVDLLSVAGHKFYAPKGIGALYMRTGTLIEKLIHGASHEFNLRAGTENVPWIVGLGAAAEWVHSHLTENMQHFLKTRDLLEQELRNALTDRVRVNGHPEKRLPNTLNISLRDIQASALLDELHDQVAASAGAACHSDSVTISPVLQAMGVPMEWALGAIRFSTGLMTTEEEIHIAARKVTEVYQKLQNETTGSILLPEEEIRLTQYTHGLGCACKLRPQDLEKVLQRLPTPNDPRLLVGAETSDDAAVYQISDETAIVQTVDFFTPIVDDPFDFGAIAAVNALSDIYAMGGKPLWALNLVAFPIKRLPVRVLERILEGAQSIAEKAGIVIGGGHTIEDNEPKFGMAVSGIIHPKKIHRNHTARPGDALFLTKPIGTGIATTALKRGFLPETTRHQVMESMLTLNEVILTIQEHFTVTACTDVTGFGLLGHLLEMTGKGNLGAWIEFSSVPIFEGVRELALSEFIPGGTLNNLEYIQPYVDWASSRTRIERLLLCDAQTSGGLLFTVPVSEADRLKQFCREKRMSVFSIGMIQEGKRIIVV